MNLFNRTESPSPTHTVQRPAAFTITELLVIMSLIAIVMSTVLPATSVMRDMVSSNAAMGTAAVAVTTAQAYALVGLADLQDNGDPDNAGFTYSGTAVLFTPAGEIRLVENDQTATDGSTLLESTGLNGYRDIGGRDYVQLPKDAGVVGIARGGAGDPDLFTPPFAIRFNERGNLIASGTELVRMVCYDGNDYDGDFETAFVRPANYDPDDWDPTVTTVATDANRYKLPFEQIETVVGVVVYSKKDLRDAGLTHIGSLTRNAINAAARDWILDEDNSEIILFNRQTGTMIKQ